MPAPVIRDTMMEIYNMYREEFTKKFGIPTRSDITPTDIYIQDLIYDGTRYFGIGVVDLTPLNTTFGFTDTFLRITYCEGIYHTVIQKINHPSKHEFDADILVGRKHMLEFQREFDLGPTH